MTPKAKIAITIPASLLDDVRAAVHAGHAANVSAYVTAALTEKTKSDSLEDLLDEVLERTGGPMTDEERAEIDRMVGWE